MLITNYTTIQAIIERLNRFTIPGGYWNIEEIKEWTYDALSAIGTIEDKVEISATVEIIDNKGVLPDNLMNVRTVLDGDSGFDMEYLNIGATFTNELQYKIYNSHIYVNFAEGFVTINYLGSPEKDGLPIIPDNRYFVSAVESYIKYKIGERSFWQNKILFNQLQLLEQEWLFYLPAAKNSVKMNILQHPDAFRKIRNRHFM
jgi:hypothetical protein